MAIEDTGCNVEKQDRNHDKGREVWVIKRAGNVAVAWCPECGQQVEMVTPDEAASRTHLGARAIYRRVEAGSIHYLELSGGGLLVCTNSIGDVRAEMLDP